MEKKVNDLENLLEEISIFTRNWTNKASKSKVPFGGVSIILKGNKLINKKVDWQVNIIEGDTKKIKKKYKELKELGLSDKKILKAKLLKREIKVIKRNYEELRALGLKDKDIASRAEMLGKNPESIKEKYKELEAFGISNKQIRRQPELLGRSFETIKKNYRVLQKLGVRKKKILSEVQLLELNPKTINKNYQRLRKLGLSRQKIALRAVLLGRDPKTIEINYQKHIGLLKENYEDRNSARKLLLEYAPILLQIPPETIEANIQYLNYLGMHQQDARPLQYGMLLGTKPQTKRKKVAWMLRELFDYNSDSLKEKKNFIKNLYKFVKENPDLLIESESLLKRKRDTLLKRIQEFNL